MSELTKEQKEQLDAKAQAEAKVRAEKIDAFGNKILDQASAEGLTINDVQVVLNTILEQTNMVFRSRKVSEFVEKKETKEIKEIETAEETK